jgi:hypothetical protein
MHRRVALAIDRGTAALVVVSIQPGRALPKDLRTRLATAGLPCLMTVARLHGTPSTRALRAIEGIRDHLLMTSNMELSALPSLEPEAMAAMFDGELSPETLELLERTAKAFRVDAAPVISYRHVSTSGKPWCALTWYAEASCAMPHEPPCAMVACRCWRQL